jgi:hypothetical protein
MQKTCGTSAVSEPAAGTPRMPDISADIAAVIAAWAHLPEPVRAGILAMVKAATMQGR